MKNANNAHPWVDGAYSTNLLRDMAMEVKENISGIAVDEAGTLSKKDQMNKKVMTALAVAADHIDRLHGALPPKMVSISADSDNDLYALDDIGRVFLWCPFDGWCLLQVATETDDPT